MVCTLTSNIVAILTVDHPRKHLFSSHVNFEKKGRNPILLNTQEEKWETNFLSMLMHPRKSVTQFPFLVINTRKNKIGRQSFSKFSGEIKTLNSSAHILLYLL
jgi:hypothetical protein